MSFKPSLNPRIILRRLLGSLARACGQELIPVSRNALETELVWARNMQRLGGPAQDRLLYLSRPVETVHLRWLLELHKITTTIDVGANRGQFAHHLREAGFNGELHCFEPQPEVQNDLKSVSGARVHAFALGSSDTNLELTRYAEDSFSSFHSISPQGRASFGNELLPVSSYTVPVRRLDALWAELGSPDAARCFLKTDTQGHDLAVLQGAGALLNRIPLVLTEAPINPLYEDSASFAQLCDFLAAHGLHLSGTYPVSFDPVSGALLELNAWFTRHQTPSMPV